MATSKTSKSSKASKKTNKASSKAAAKAAAAKFGSKSEFVRSNPGLSAPELVALADKQGISLTTSHVYNIRATDKKKRTGGTTEAPALRAAAVTGAVSNSSDAENQFRLLLIRLGTDKVDQLLVEFRSSPMFALPTQGSKVTRRRTSPVQQSTRPASVPPPAPAQETAQHAS